ncbi:hypothetical protein GHT09_011514 [Marmota monax]|uniref:Tyrosine specific protein phosphatases domain-containing protein n=1 Tax=Marmota monax TaxID=9995 RepID=A0A834QFN1_MARMO|nr:hypothetical protein GHT09_011514 [Marmota monax]
MTCKPPRPVLVEHQDTVSHGGQTPPPEAEEKGEEAPWEGESQGRTLPGALQRRGKSEWPQGAPGSREGALRQPPPWRGWQSESAAYGLCRGTSLVTCGHLRPATAWAAVSPVCEAWAKVHLSHCGCPSHLLRPDGVLHCEDCPQLRRPQPQSPCGHNDSALGPLSSPSPSSCRLPLPPLLPSNSQPLPFPKPLNIEEIVLLALHDGAGRSGTYVLIDMVLNKMAKGAKEIDIAATLEHLRDQRPGMVQTKEQFEFALTAVAEEVNAILKALPQ